MPTGYTAKLTEQEQSFEEFVWTCARAFGALIHMRDDRIDAPIQTEPDSESFAAKSLEEDQRELLRLGKLSRADCDREAAAEYAKAVDAREKIKAEVAEKKKRLDAMLVRVIDWNPPTPEHAGLRTFMLEQLQETIRYDCSIPGAPTKLDGYTWVQGKLERLARSLQWSAESATEHEKNRRSRKEWVEQLARSVPMPKPTKGRP